MQQDTQPQQAQYHQLRVEEMRNHGVPSLPDGGRGHCTRFSSRWNYPQRGGTRPAGIVALHIHLPTTSTTDFPEIPEPDLEDRYAGCADGIARHFTGEVPVQKVKPEA